ncbi:peptidase A22B, signal peptide peptidase, partial [Elsinoe ampelina]
AALPYLPMSLHLVVSALIPIYTGSYASLSRPSSTVKPKKRTRKSKKSRVQDGLSDSDEETSGSDDEENDIVTKMEGMSPSDAILFPLLAGCTLAGLYMLIKYMGAALLNKILAVYFGAMAFFSVARMINDVLAVTQNFVFPKYYCANSILWKVDQNSRIAFPMGTSIRATRPGIERAMQARRGDPLPGSLGGRSLGAGLVDLLWQARGMFDKKYLVAFHLRGIADIKARVSFRSIASSVIAVMVLLYANFISTPWYLTNLQGFAFSYTALQLLSPTTFGTGSLILVALFFYDIYFVFYTPLMVSVATNLDVPIKLLFPRPEEEGRKPGLAMLGLGDVVLPGIMIGLALRFDLYLHYRRRQQTKKNAQGKDEVDKPKYVSVTGKWGDYHWVGNGSIASRNTKRITIDDILPRFSRTYFHASIVGYILGMSVTLIIMHVFKHAQPALLYLVPGVLGSVWSTALVKGEVKEMWEYTELVDDEDDDDDKKEKPKKDE